MPTNLPTETTQVAVYFATGRSLLQELRVVNAQNKYADTLTKWLAGDPTSNPDVAVVQPQAKVKSVTFKDGVLTVDWDRGILDFSAAPKEKVLAWAGILETLGQFPEVQKIAFTVEGKTTGTINGKDVHAFWGNVSLNGSPWKAPRPPLGGSNVATAAPTPKK